MNKLPRSISVQSCESFLDKMLSGEIDDLTIALDSQKQSFAGLASTIQAAITWGRKSANSNLKIPSTEKSLDDLIDEIIKRPHNFTAAMFSKSIITNNGVDVRKEVNLAAKNSVEKQSEHLYGQQRGGLCWFAFVDHSSKGFDKNFYFNVPSEKAHPRRPAQIRAIIRTMVEKSLSIPGGSELLDDDTTDSLGRIFNELFLNTHEHGSRDIRHSDWLKPGVRIIYTNGINLSVSAAESSIDQDPALKKYIAHGDGRVRYVEISIVDSGLGYCKRWLADREDVNDFPSKISEEYKIFKKCFKFRQSSREEDSKGNGLPIVMDRLTALKGFMRVRSGRLALYRDFVSSPYHNDDECDFYDWDCRELAGNKLTAKSEVEGVAITLLVPLRSKSSEK